MPKTSSNSISAEILKLFPIWRHDGLTPLTTITGYATLLLEIQAENLTEQQKQFITMIRNAAMKASTSWHNPGDYITLSFDFENARWKWSSVQLSEICDMILSKSFKYINKSNVDVDISDKLAPVRADPDWLAIAIANLLEPSVGYLYNAEFRSSISAKKSDDDHVLVSISTGLELSMDESYKSIESISSPGNSLSVASMIFEKHESHLQFKRLRNDRNEYKSLGTEFEFSLPIWQE
jgi:K+-sensing histidine kinase KdpD